MNYEETNKEIEIHGMGSLIYKNTPKDRLSRMCPLSKKHQMGESIIPPK
jgi:hypothetical protein